MTAKTSTFQHRRLLDDVRAVVPLEIMIRAANRAMPDKMQELRRIEAGMRQVWLDAGFPDEVIDYDQHLEDSWDFIQLGWRETRRLNRVWSPEDWAAIRSTHQRVNETFASQVQADRYPFAARFRYADLLRGMNIERVLSEFDHKLPALNDERRNTDGSIPLVKFVGPLRRPVPVIPGVKQQVRFGPELPRYAGIMLRTDIPLEDVLTAMQEFRFHYALARIDDGDHSKVPSALLGPWMRPTAPSSRRKEGVNQDNQIRALLNGLYCYDRVMFYGASGERYPRKLALDDAMALKGDETIPRDTMVKQLGVIKRMVDKAVESLTV